MVTPKSNMMRLTQASKTGSSTPPFSTALCSSTYAVIVLKLLNLVVVSGLRSPLKATIKFGSEIEERFGSSARYDNLLAAAVLPKAPNPVLGEEAARLLEAAVLNWFLLIVRDLQGGIHVGGPQGYRVQSWAQGELSMVS